MHKATGILRYTARFHCGTNHTSDYKLIVEVEPDIVNYYRSLVPIKLNRQKYAPHITVVRNEVPVNLEHWSKYAGETVEFEYMSEVRMGEVYCWLNAFSDRLKNIRVELGLPVSSEYSRPPSDEDCFHITIGNLKT